MTKLAINHLSSGGIITNYHCVSRCGHCLYNCSPQRYKKYLDEVFAERVFRRIADSGCKSVHIGGGEPMLAPQKLTAVAAAARHAGVGIDYVETNSAWFLDGEQADAILRDLRSAGAGALLVSISPFHNAYIPFSRVRGVIDACRRTGMNVIAWVNNFTADLERLGEHQTHTMAEYESVYGPDYLRHIPDRYWIHLGGRALETFRPVYPTHPLKQILATSPRRCMKTLCDTSHFHIDLYGHFIPGLCAGLTIAMEDLGSPLSAGKYILLETLAADGISGLYHLARQRHGYRPCKDAYLNHCDLCTDIRRFLVQSTTTPFAELAPLAFYAELTA